MRKQLGFLIIMVAFCAACTPQYVKPEAGLTANLRVTTPNQMVYAWIHTYREEDCKSPVALGAIGPENMSPITSHNGPIAMLGSKTSADSRIVEEVIPAEKPLTLLITQIGPVTSSTVTTCHAPFQFVPRAGKNYEVLYDFQGKECLVGVSELSLSADNSIARTPISILTKKENDCSPFSF